MSAVTAIYHLVINTYCRRMTIPDMSCDQLYRYIGGVIREKSCKVYAINGVENHIHILFSLHQSVSLSNLVRDIKVSSNSWIKIHQASYPMFEGWGKEYGAFSYAMRDRDMVANYISRQKEHHKRVTYEAEYQKLLENAGIEWDDRRLT